MFKKALLSFAMVAFSGSVLAAPTANIYVKGKIGAPTCTINGQDTADLVFNFDVDFEGDTYFDEQNNHYRLVQQGQDFNIDCDASTSIFMNVIDAREGTSSSDSNEYGFGLGMHDQTKVGFYDIKIGGLFIKESSESEEKLAYFVRNGEVTQSTPNPWLTPGESFGWAVDGNYAVARHFSGGVIVIPYINAELKNVAEEVELDGLAILSFSFGI